MLQDLRLATMLQLPDAAIDQREVSTVPVLLVDFSKHRQLKLRVEASFNALRVYCASSVFAQALTQCIMGRKQQGLVPHCIPSCLALGCQTISFQVLGNIKVQLSLHHQMCG